MTEEEWRACESIDELLSQLGTAASPRKLRLLACASCRRLWDVLKGRADRQAVEVAEQYADCTIPDARRADARRKTRALLTSRQGLGNQYNPAHYAAGRTQDQANELRCCLHSAINVAFIVEPLRTVLDDQTRHD